MAYVFTAMQTQKEWQATHLLGIGGILSHSSRFSSTSSSISGRTQRQSAERMEDMKRLENEAIAWSEKRNAKEAKVDWRFTTEDARIKLKKLYPSLQE